MADFSLEYYKNEGTELSGDFSIIQEFLTLNEDESSYEICEGFGITEIKNIDGECWVKINNRMIRFKDFMDYKTRV